MDIKLGFEAFKQEIMTQIHVKKTANQTGSGFLAL